MNSLLIDELSQTGLQTISIIFNSSSRFNGSKWETIKNDEGQQLYKELSLSMNYRIDEVHSTVWQNGYGLRKDTCFSVNMEFPFIKKRNEVKLVIESFLCDIRAENLDFPILFCCFQIFLICYIHE